MSTAAARLATAEVVAPAGGLPIEWGEEIEPRLNAQWLIKGVLPQQGVAVIYGHPGSGKSFLAIDFAMHIALGREWNGCTTRKGVVVYIAAEGQSGLRNRVDAFRRRNELSGPLPFALIPVPVDLYDAKADLQAIVAAVQRAAKRYDLPVAAIVVDTVSKTMGAGKENTDDMAVYVGNCGWLSAEFECLVIPVHHRPKDKDSSDMRGHSSLRGGIETAILVESGTPKRARITKQKDGEERDLLAFDLELVELGFDDEGDMVTSCVIVPTVAPYGSAPVGPQQRVNAGKSDNHKIVFGELERTLEAAGVTVPNEIPDDLLDRHRVGKVVSLKTFQDRAEATLRTGSDNKPDTARTQVKRAKEALQAKGFIGVWEDWVWIKY